MRNLKENKETETKKDVIKVGQKFIFEDGHDDNGNKVLREFKVEKKEGSEWRFSAPGAGSFTADEDWIKRNAKEQKPSEKKSPWHNMTAEEQRDFARKEIHNAFRKYKSSVGVYGQDSEVAENDSENLISLLDDAFLSRIIPFSIFGAGYDYLVNLKTYGETHPRTVDSAYYFENLLID